MKKIIALLLLSSVNIAFAEDIFDVAKVIRITPRYQTLTTPSSQCQTVSEVVPKEKSLAGSIIGGVAGGIIGSQIGKGSGRVAAGAVGAGVGAIVGDRVQNDGSSEVRNVQQCTQVKTSQQILEGYIATLRYNGHETDVFTNNQYNVGDRVRVRVGVSLD
jgi:uncharacterized protein YcfJ